MQKDNKYVQWNEETLQLSKLDSAGYNSISLLMLFKRVKNIRQNQAVRKNFGAIVNMSCGIGVESSKEPFTFVTVEDKTYGSMI